MVFSTRILGSILQGSCRFQLHLSEWEETSFIQFSRVWFGVRGENSGETIQRKTCKLGIEAGVKDLQVQQDL